MTPDDALLAYVLRLGDTALVTGQRMIERVTGEPELEEELANANFALDYVGQARLFYTLAGKLEGRGRGEDDFAFLRDSQEFRNLLLAEQPNGHFGDAIVRQFLYESFYLLQLEALADCSAPELPGIAARAKKEIAYHLRHAAQWLTRLGDGTRQSREKVSESLQRYWRYTSEFFAADEVDDVIRDVFDGPDLAAIEPAWRASVEAVLENATLDIPGDEPLAGSGRAGLHSEHLGYLVAEMQHLHRAHPGASW